MFDFKSLHVLVIGDLMLDQYIEGQVNRISPEAPVQILEQSGSYTKLGGAANVAANLISLGAKTTLLGVVGDDIEQKKMAALLKENTIDSQLIVDKNRPTTLKTRLLADEQQILRVDKEETSDISFEIADTLINHVKVLLSSNTIDFIILQDYNKGVFTPYVIPQIIEISKQHTIPIGVDPKVHNIEYYKGATFLKPNLREAIAMLNINETTFVSNLETYARQLLNWLELEEVWITLSEKGVCGVNRKGEFILQPTQVSEVVDVCGAGDAVICIISLLTCQNATLQTKAKATNAVGSIVCSKPGVVTVSQSELQAIWKT